MTAKEAGKKCKVWGYIARKSDLRIKLWKNTVGFEQCLPNLPGKDWACFEQDKKKEEDKNGGE